MMLTRQQAQIESQRCLYCFDAPCSNACPVHIDIPQFIAMIRSGNVGGAAEVVKTSHALANVCGKVCPEEVFCQSVCNRAKQDEPIMIRELHFFATQQEAQRGYSPLRSFARNGKKVAIIGAGPAGLGCAFELVKLGCEVHVYDEKGLGGVPRNSIPAFRLSDDELRSDIEFLSPHFSSHQMRVDAIAFRQICQQYDAVFVGVGLGVDKQLGIRGEHLNGVFPVLDFLERAKRTGRGIADRVVIVGGGNVSLDAAATAKRFGAKDVVLIYRRSEEEMKVWKNELDEAKKQGVKFQFLTSPVEVVGNDHVIGLRCCRNRLSDERDASGRPIPLQIENSHFVINADAVIIAIGQQIKSDFVNQLERTEQGHIKVDEKCQTSMRGVFAGGDAIAGEGTIVQSVAQGKMAAHRMNDFIHYKLTQKKHG